MLNIRTATLSIGLVALLLLVVPLLTAWTEPVVGDSSSQINSGAGSFPSASLAKPRLPYRSQFDECFDVPLRELAACRADRKPPAFYSAPQLDECFDVSISELASCRAGSQSPAP
jgi:hypothetical protein